MDKQYTPSSHPSGNPPRNPSQGPFNPTTIKEEPVRRASVETGGAMVFACALVLTMKYVFKTEITVADALIISTAIGLIANWLTGEIARLKVTAPEKRA